jgi:hypothetical protein
MPNGTKNCSKLQLLVIKIWPLWLWIQIKICSRLNLSMLKHYFAVHSIKVYLSEYSKEKNGEIERIKYILHQSQ